MTSLSVNNNFLITMFLPTVSLKRKRYENDSPIIIVQNVSLSEDHVKLYLSSLIDSLGRFRTEPQAG